MTDDVVGQTSENDRDNRERVTRKYEEIYRFAQKAYAEETASSDLLEKRIFNFLTISLVLLGLCFTVFSESTRVLLAHRSFFLCLSVCVAAALVSVVSLFWAVRAGKVKLPPVGKPPVDYLKHKTTYLQALGALSEKYMEAAQFNNNNRTTKMARWSSVGYWSLFVAIVLFVISIAQYLVLS